MKYFIGHNRKMTNYNLKSVIYNEIFLKENCLILTDEIKDIDYDKLLSNKRYNYKGNILMLNFVIDEKINSKIDGRLVDQILKRFPNNFKKPEKVIKFWNFILGNAKYSYNFYLKYKNELGESRGLLNVYDLTYEQLLKHKKLFDSEDNFFDLLLIGHIKETLIGFSDYFVKYTQSFYKHFMYVDFLKKQMIDIDLIKELIDENEYKSFFDILFNKAILEENNYRVHDFYLIDYDEKNPSFETRQKHEDILIKKLKDMIN